MFLEKLLLVQDVVLGTLNNVDVSDDLGERIKKLAKEVNVEIDGLIDWIQQPTYSPDHSVGINMMKNAEQDFNSQK